VKDLNAKIRAYIDGWNDRSHSFTWTSANTQTPLLQLDQTTAFHCVALG
jgi:hypothetical protein